MSGIIGVSPDMRSGVIGAWPKGHVVQTVYHKDNTVETITDGNTSLFASKAIIPKQANSYFLLSGQTSIGRITGTPNAFAYFYDGSSNLGTFTDGSRPGGLCGAEIKDNQEELANMALEFLDTTVRAVGTSVTFSVKLECRDGELVSNRVGYGGDSAWATRTYTTISIMEIAT